MKHGRKIVMILIALIIVTAFIYLLNSSMLAGKGCTDDAKICPDGSSVGRDPENNCEFRECLKNEIEHFCSSEERGVGVCTEIYQPVCGWFDPEKIVCVRYPCAQTFSNSCFACQDLNVEYWTTGECPN